MQKKHWKLSPNLCKNLPPMSAPSEKHSKGGLDHDPIVIETRISPGESLVLGFHNIFFCRYHVTAVRRPTGRTGVSSRQPASDTILNRGRVIMTDHITWLHPKDEEFDIFHQPNDGWHPSNSVINGTVHLPQTQDKIWQWQSHVNRISQITFPMNSSDGWQ